MARVIVNKAKLDAVIAQAVESEMPRILDEIGQDAKRVMQSYAPYPNGQAFGKGSHATGKTHDSIVIEKRGENAIWVGTKNIEYANFAESGRKGFSAKNKMLVWKDGHGRVHRTLKVAPMEGWHFVEKTKEYLINQYK